MGLKNILQNQYIAKGIKLNYYEVENNLPVLVMLHAQGTDATSFNNTFNALSKIFHIFSVDCPGHGSSDKDKSHYNIVSIGNAIVDFAENLVGNPFYIVGHSSGGLIAAYVASKTEMCSGLILEDPPLFSCQGQRRYKTFNYLDLSTVCHNYIEQNVQEDFVIYYFERQKMWEFFPNKSREKIKLKLLSCARKYRIKHPHKPLKVPFFPKSALEAYRGMNEYDPYFGDAFYNDTFNGIVLHAEILKSISCKTLLMKAKTNYDSKKVLLAAMSEEDANLVQELMDNCELVRFDCGHGIHIEKKNEFIQALINFVK
ncbi:alpha/beta fold hydrolase [Sedimentibacter sp. zth1]|uniref:alpha/beta fold hydrolase n=1 Tax=Sedimentibacter sp. zth1 TaxID=2816908 RepID=UPI001A929009|nr:alpha/beta fold hydrolase [Sedimentibacter sp. zth1]QSX05923.1 alpha/beta fold hydrolase [Sedimentibacter sp. zth1]QSX07239.1 alpha/beta fold hydrolase [Sedimentibacter sp. zth1]